MILCLSSVTDISLLKFLANSFHWIKSVHLLSLITIVESDVWALQLTYLKWKNLAIFSVTYEAAQNATILILTRYWRCCEDLTLKCLYSGIVLTQYP